MPIVDDAANTLALDATGQLTLSKDMLAHLGDEVVVAKLMGGRLEIRAARQRGKISDVFGFLKDKTNRRLSLEEINDAAADGWAGKR